MTQVECTKPHELKNNDNANIIVGCLEFYIMFQVE
jgi:hypothetical protein